MTLILTISESSPLVVKIPGAFRFPNQRKKCMKMLLSAASCKIKGSSFKEVMKVELRLTKK